ncbi:MAG: O-antigen ligase family protein [Bacteroidota bacterium]
MFSEKIHRYIFLFGVCSLGFGMMIGAVPTSVPVLILLGNWVIELNFRQKWEKIKTNTLFWILSSVFFIHVIGVFYSSDLQAAISDLNIKAPLFILPLVFLSAKPLSRKEFHFVLCCFLIGAFVDTAWCLAYSFIIHHNEVGRDASRFMSHIRLGLYLNMAVACSIYFAATLAGTFKKCLMLILAVWFIWIMYVLGLASGLANLFILSFITVCVVVYRQKPLVKVLAFLLLVVATVLIARYIGEVSRSQLSVNNTANNIQARKSLSGRPYSHFDTKGQKENGNYVLINIQLDELKKEWRLQFPADSFSFHPRAHNINRYEVLIRYLASRGLNKDSVGLSQLSDVDKSNIQKDICNYRYTDWNFMQQRIYELVCEYDDFINRRDVNGHSLTMRFYFWHAAAQVISEHPLYGVGTGDVQAELNRVYERSDSPLEREWYKRPHNQFLTVLLALGIPGTVIFLFGIFYPAIRFRKQLSVLYWPFFILALVSFIPEDTLETQAGVTFYAFFNTLFLSVAYYRQRAGEKNWVEV